LDQKLIAQQIIVLHVV